MSNDNLTVNTSNFNQNIDILNQRNGWLENNSFSVNNQINNTQCSCSICQQNQQNISNYVEGTTTTIGENKIDSLLAGSKWDSNTITYSFYSDSKYNGQYYDTNETGVREVSQAVKNNVRTILNDISKYINITFQEVTEDNSINTGQVYGTIRYMLSSQPDYAYAYYPGYSNISGDIFLQASYDNNTTTNGFQTIPGNHGYMTLIHETGHALGLKHPGNYNGSGSGTGPFLPDSEDNTTNTLMSYNFAGYSASTLMPYDIKALQYIYGARQYNNTATTYKFQQVDLYQVGSLFSHTSSSHTKQTIWDSGGIDTLDFSLLPFDSSGYRFDMNEGGILTSQSAYNRTSYTARNSTNMYNTSNYGTVVAFDTVIENLINSNSSDYIIANTASNIFSGYRYSTNKGNDIIIGANNQDILDLSSYIQANVLESRLNNDLVLNLGTDTSITVKDYYFASANQRLNILYSSQNEVKLTKNPSNDVFTVLGSNGAKLRVSLTEKNSNLVNELGVFNVDDANGTIDGISPGQSGYTEKALARAKVIFSIISELKLPNGFSQDGLTTLLETDFGDNLRFLLVNNSSIDSVLSGKASISNVLISSNSTQIITDLGNDTWKLSWEDTSGALDFKDIVVNIQATSQDLLTGTSFQSSRQGEVIDLRNITQQVRADFIVNREAAFNNFVGFYEIIDENGGIDINGDGRADILPGQGNYIQTAVNSRITGVDLFVGNQGTANFTANFRPGIILAPFIIVNSNANSVLDNNPNNDPQVYFPFLGANTDGVDHIRLLGNNIFGFEDLVNGGDFDYNDTIVRVNFT
jgi:Domain of unknown function (DUF4114)/Metallo-peptidase family M12B Reprolysin-like